MERIREATVTAVKPSEVRKNIFYITVSDGLGEIKVMSTKSYELGSVIKIKKRNPVDWIWDIVKEAK